jgi:ribosome-binding factor A
MSVSSTKTIKQSKKESQFFREITQLLREVALDEPELGKLTISRVALSPDSGICTVFFYMPEGEQEFSKLLETLKLYRPSLRKALAHRINSRYTPELVFKFDTRFEKHQKLEELFEKIKTEPSS